MKQLLILALLLCIAFIQGTNAQSWVSLNGPQIASNVKDITITADGQTLYAADASYILKSTSGGTAWAVTAQPYSGPVLVLVKPNDAAKIVAATSGQLAYNAQGGSAGTWDVKINDVNLVPLRLAAAVNDNTVMLLGRTFVSGNNAIWRSDNSGARWSQVTDFTPATDIHDFAPYPNNTSGYPAGIVWAAGSSDASPSPSYDKTATAEIRGLSISENYGQTWPYNKLGGYNVVSVAIVSRQSPIPYHFYAATSASSRDTLT